MTRLTISTLLVEDNAADAESLNGMLDSMAWATFATHQVQSLRGALALLERKHFDLIFLSFPVDREGLDALPVIRAINGHTPLIVLRRSAERDTLQSVDDMNVSASLVKGHFDGEALSKIVQRAMLDCRADTARSPVVVFDDPPAALETREGANVPDSVLHDAMLNERALMAALYTSQDLILITDQKGLVRHVNPAFSEATGFSGRELLGERADIAFGETQTDSISEKMKAALSSDGVWTGQISSRCKSGELLRLNVTVTVVRDDGGELEGYVIVSRAKTELAELQSQLDQSMRLNAIGKLAGGIAHEFNNALQIIVSHAAQIAEQTKGAQPHLNEYALSIGEAARRAADLTRQLQIFGRKQNVQIERLDLNDRIMAALRFMERLLGGGCTVTTHLEPSLPPILADATLIEQIVTGLCVCARDAMAGDGEILIETDRNGLDRALCDAQGRAAEGDYLHLAVSDSRPGISSERLTHLLEAAESSTVSDELEGTALASLSRAVKQFNGLVHCDSEIGGRTTVHVYFPIAVNKTPDVALEVDPQKPALETGLRILIAEDDPLLSALSTTLLESAGYKVTVVRDGLGAFQELLAASEPYSLVLSDVVMPKIGGIELMSRAMASPSLSRKPLFLLNTGCSANEIAEKVPEGVHYGYLHKPYSPADLVRMVRKMLQN